MSIDHWYLGKYGISIDFAFGTIKIGFSLIVPSIGDGRTFRYAIGRINRISGTEALVDVLSYR